MLSTAYLLGSLAEKPIQWTDFQWAEAAEAPTNCKLSLVWSWSGCSSPSVAFGVQLNHSHYWINRRHVNVAPVACSLLHALIIVNYEVHIKTNHWFEAITLHFCCHGQPAESRSLRRIWCCIWMGVNETSTRAAKETELQSSMGKKNYFQNIEERIQAGPWQM